MRILIVSATIHELQLLLTYLEKNSDNFSENEFQYKSIKIHCLITGIGATHTVFSLSEHLNSSSYDLIINLGIGGAFNHNMPIGSVCNVTMDRFGDLGVENDNESFSDVFEIGLMDRNTFPYSSGWIKLDNVYPLAVDLPKAKGYTVNKVTGSERSIKAAIEKYHPEVETMEGAGFAYATKMFKVNSIQLRAISNHVEPRNKANWNIPLAIENLTKVTIDLINGLS